MINALQSATWAPWTLLAFDVWCARAGVRAARRDRGRPGDDAARRHAGGLLLRERALRRARRRPAAHRWRTDPGARRGCRCWSPTRSPSASAPCSCCRPRSTCCSRRAPAASIRRGVMRLALRPLGVFAFLLPRHYVDPSGRFHETAALWEGDLTDAPVGADPLPRRRARARRRRRRQLSRFQRRWWLARRAWCSWRSRSARSSPGYRWTVEHVPLLRAVRYPEKFLLVVHGLLAVGDGARPRRARCAIRSASRIVRRVAIVFAAAAVVAAARPSTCGRASRARCCAPISLIAAAGFAWSPRWPALGRRCATRRGAGASSPWQRSICIASTASCCRPSPGARRCALPSSARGDRARRRSAAHLQRRRRPARRAVVSRQLRAGAEPAAHGGRELLRHRQPQRPVVDQPARPRAARGAHRERARASRSRRCSAAFNTAYVTSPKDLQRYPGLTPVLKPTSAVEAYVYAVDGVTPRAFVAPALEPVADAGGGAGLPARQRGAGGARRGGARRRPTRLARRHGRQRLRIDVYRPQRGRARARRCRPTAWWC